MSTTTGMCRPIGGSARLALLALLWTGALSACGSTGPPPAAPEAICRRVQLGREVTSPNGLQVLRSGDFLVASPLEGTLTRFDAEGRELWTRHGEVEPPGNFERPAAIALASAAGDLLIQERLDTFYLADPEGRVVQRVSFEESAAKAGLIGFVAAAFGKERSEMRALALLHSERAGELVAGLAHARFDGSGWSRPAATFPLSKPPLDSLSLDLRMVAPYQNGLAVLLIGTGGSEHEVRLITDAASRSVPLVIEELAPYPSELRLGQSTMGAAHQQLRRLRLPVGIYGDRSTLFVLVASPGAADSGRVWELLPIDLETGAAKARYRLPTGADEVGISAGKSHWIVLEKRVLGVEGEVRAARALVVPADWFHRLDSPLVVSPGGSPATCVP